MQTDKNKWPLRITYFQTGNYPGPLKFFGQCPTKNGGMVSYCEPSRRCALLWGSTRRCLHAITRIILVKSSCCYPYLAFPETLLVPLTLNPSKGHGPRNGGLLFYRYPRGWWDRRARRSAPMPSFQGGPEEAHRC